MHTYRKEGSSIILISKLARPRTELIYSLKGVEHLYALHTSRKYSFGSIFHIQIVRRMILAFSRYNVA